MGPAQCAGPPNQSALPNLCKGFNSCQPTLSPFLSLGEPPFQDTLQGLRGSGYVSGAGRTQLWAGESLKLFARLVNFLPLVPSTSPGLLPSECASSYLPSSLHSRSFQLWSAVFTEHSYRGAKFKVIPRICVSISFTKCSLKAFSTPATLLGTCVWGTGGGAGPVLMAHCGRTPLLAGRGYRWMAAASQGLRSDAPSQRKSDILRNCSPLCTRHLSRFSK